MRPVSFTLCAYTLAACSASNPVLPNDASCTADDDCMSGTCDHGYCAPAGFAFVPAGVTYVGTDTRSASVWSDSELPMHPVTISRDLWVGRNEVTQAQWTDRMGYNPAQHSRCGGDCPVERVSYDEVLVYANRLSSEQGLDECYDLGDCVGDVGSNFEVPFPADCSENFRCPPASRLPRRDCTGFRLPTEQEWEHFTRAGTRTDYFSGDSEVGWEEREEPALNGVGWYNENADETPLARAFCPEGVCGPGTVGMLAPNPFGLYDVHGNVWEWTSSRGGEIPYGTNDPQVDPMDREIGDHDRVVLRGGSYPDAAGQLRSANRGHIEPCTHTGNAGFRLVRTISPRQALSNCDGWRLPHLCARRSDSYASFNESADVCSALDGMPISNLTESDASWLVAYVGERFWVGTVRDQDSVSWSDGTTVEPDWGWPGSPPQVDCLALGPDGWAAPGCDTQLAVICNLN